MLAALAGGEPMTAGEVAEKSGLARATVSSTLSRLARSGEVQKAERGYRLEAADAPTKPANAAATATIAVAPSEPTTTTTIDTPAGDSDDAAPGETVETPGAEASGTPAGETAHAAAGAPNRATSTVPDPNPQ